MKTIVRKLFNKAGYGILKLRNSNSTHESNFMNIIRSKNIECVIDVGANAGQYGTYLRQIGYKGHILSFEPVSLVFDKLTSTSQQDSKWHCFHHALGDKNEKKQIKVYKSTVFSSFLDANEYSQSLGNSLSGFYTEEVHVKRLEDIFSDLMTDIGDVGCLLKMDTQGYDLEVFKGARGSLEHVQALQSEISIIHVYEGMPDGLAALKLYRDNGYYVSGMYPVNREESLAVIEFDCLLVKRG